MNRPERVRRHVGKAKAGTRRWALVFFVVLAAAAMGYGVSQAVNDPRFAARVESVAGAEHETPAQILAAAELQPGRNAWLLPRRAMARNIAALPWVKNASVSVSWPNVVRIRVTEREPVARVELAPSLGLSPVFALIDSTQRVLDLATDPTQAANLPLIEVVPPVAASTAPGQTLADKDVGAALTELQELRSLGLQISAVAIAPSTGLSATADRNVRVLFGDDDELAKKAQLFLTIVAKISTPSSIAYVDVRSVRAPTVLYR